MDILGYLALVPFYVLVAGFVIYRFGYHKKNKKIELSGKRAYQAGGLIILIWLILAIGQILIWGIED